ncbi:MAG: hypothetical protein ABI551_19300 [Polyangiaceae bacterium]
MAFTLAIACGGGNDNLPPPPPPPPPPPAMATASSAPAEDAGAPEAPKAPPVTLTAGTASPDPAAPLPSVTIKAPTKDQLIDPAKASDFIVKLDVKNWATAPGNTHVHLILDNKAYKPIYDPKAPVKLSELTGGEPLAEGQHVIVAFPSRANHESVKTKGALAFHEFYVGKKKGEATVDVKKPILVYSRPKGIYRGDQGNHVIVDFNLINDTLGEGKDHVMITVSGQGIEKDLTADVKSFGAPYYLDNLRNGSYTVKLDLLDKDVKPVPGAWNSISRTFTVDHDAQPDAMPAPAASAAPAASGKPAPTASAKPKGK